MGESVFVIKPRRGDILIRNSTENVSKPQRGDISAVPHLAKMKKIMMSLLRSFGPQTPLVGLLRCRSYGAKLMYPFYRFQGGVDASKQTQEQGRTAYENNIGQ